MHQATSAVRSAMADGPEVFPPILLSAHADSSYRNSENIPHINSSSNINSTSIQSNNITSSTTKSTTKDIISNNPNPTQPQQECR
jgi:hypothetical protein